MIAKHVQKILGEAQKQSGEKNVLDLAELEKKATQILEAFIFKNLRLKNPKTYSLVFTENFVPIGLDSLHQIKCALAALIDLINKGEYLDLPNSKVSRSTLYYTRTEREIRESFDVFEELFNKYPGQRDTVIKDLNKFAHLLSKEGLSESLGQFGGDLQKEIKYLEDLLEDVLTWDDFRLYYGNEAEVMSTRVQRLLSLKIAKRELSEVKEKVEMDIKDKYLYPDIFAPDGYRLFNSLVNTIQKKGHGFQAEVGHFFRLMEYDTYAKKGDTRFMDWFAIKYRDYPELTRMRLLKEFRGPSHKARSSRYYEVKRSMGLK